MYFSRMLMELVTCRELVTKFTLLIAFWTKRFEPIKSVFVKFAGPPIFAMPRTSRLFAINEPFGAKKFPRVMISPRAPKFPSEEMFPSTNKLLPVLILPVVFTVPSTSRAPRFFQGPCIYAE